MSEQDKDPDVMSPLHKNDPSLIAWEEWKKSERFPVCRQWALNEQHVDGSLWEAFLAGRSSGLKEAASDDVKQLKPNYGPAYAAAMYPGLAEIFHRHGYALAVHGSLARDLDLIAVPWREEISDIATVLKDVTTVFAVRQTDEGVQKNHGRKAYTLSCGFGECAIDLSFLFNNTLASVEHVEQEEEKQALEEKETDVNAESVATQKALKEALTMALDEAWFTYRPAGYGALYCAMCDCDISKDAEHDRWCYHWRLNEILREFCPEIEDRSSASGAASPNPVPSPSSIVEQERWTAQQQQGNPTWWDILDGQGNPIVNIQWEEAKDALLAAHNASIERAVKQKQEQCL